MKKLFFLFIILFSSQPAFSQSGWYWQHPLPQGNNLNSVKFIDNSTLIAVGDQGVIIRSTDKGVTWSLEPSFSQKTFTSVYALDQNIIFICGDQGIILKSSNAGISWSYIGVNTLQKLNKIIFINSTIGFTIGNNGVIFRTTNLGQTWVQLNSGTTSALQSIYFMNASTGFISGGGYLLKTINSGDNWSVFAPGGFNDFQFLNELTGYSVSSYFSFPSYYGVTYKTTNGGINWNALNGSCYSSCLSLLFLDANTGFVSSSNGISYTSNAGQNWTCSYLNVCNSIDNKSNIYITVGQGGSIFRSSDNGVNWTNKSYSYSSISLWDIFFINENTGYISATEGNSDSTFVKTTNGGNNWLKLKAPSTAIFSIYFTNENTGYAGNGVALYKTTNGGINWNISRNGSSSIVCFTDANTGFVAGSNSEIYKTTNAGLNWEMKFSDAAGNIKSISFPSLSVGYACNARFDILKTENGGNSWYYLPPINGIVGQEKIIFINENTGFISTSYQGKSIFRTIDGGNSWQPVLIINDNQSIISDIDISESGTGYATCWTGRIFKTTNFGTSWFELLSNTNNRLYSVCKVSDSIVFAAGTNSTIIKTINGGTALTSINNFTNIIPSEFYLHQNYPNPFNPITIIKFDIPKTSFVKIKIYDVLGKQIATLLNEIKQAGSYSIDFNASQLSSGIFFYRLETEGFTETKKMVVQK
ncbi:MAG: T9SS type A sorting domain-containing protein [Bacteroidetes bacterium]|nr:T9SS type A sorting domain-containing protein [Bacteroidota bacterium]